MERQRTPSLSSDSKVRAHVPSRPRNRKKGFPVARKRPPSLIRLLALGLVVALAALIVTNPEIGVRKNPKQRVAAREFAANPGENSRSLSRESEASAPTKIYMYISREM